MLIILWASPSAIRTQASVPTAIITLVSCLALGILSYAEHTRSVRPSLILNGYLFLSLLFDIVRARTLWLQEYNHKIAIVFSVAVAVKCLLLLLEAGGKREILRPSYQGYPPEATSGIYNRAFFWWLNALFKKGFSQTLLLANLFALDKHLRSEYLQDLLSSTWKKGWHGPSPCPKTES